MGTGSKELFENEEIIGENGLQKMGNGNLSEQGYIENGFDQVGRDGKEKVNLADEVLENLEEYWEDISDRLMISRMVSDSVIKGMVNAVEQEAAERIAAKESEMTKLKESLHFHRTDKSTCGWDVIEHDMGSRNGVRFLGVSDACLEHEKMEESLCGLRNETKRQFDKLKREIGRIRGCTTSIKRIGSGSELVGLGGILREKGSESWIHVDKALNCLEIKMETIYTQVGDVLKSSKRSLCRWKQEQDFRGEIEDMVMQSIIRSLQEEFEEKLWEQNARLSGSPSVNLLKRFNAVSSLCMQLDDIVKSLPSPETGLVSHGSHDFDHFHRKALSNHVSPSASLCEENGKLDASNTDIPENFEFSQLKHMSKEELVDYFNTIIVKMRRDHESELHQRTEQYFSLKREYLKEKGSSVRHWKDEEFDLLRKKIPELITKLDGFLVGNETVSALTDKAESLSKLKDRLDSLLSENRQLRDSLTCKKNEVKRLEAKVAEAAGEMLQHSMAEVDMPNVIRNLKSDLEDSCIEASLREGVYKCLIRELNELVKSHPEESNMQLPIMQEIYDTILHEFAAGYETRSKSEVEDSDIQSFINQGLCALIFKESIKDAEGKLLDLHKQYLIEKENRISLEGKALDKENQLKIEIAEKERLKQVVLGIEKSLERKEKLVMDSLTKDREQLGVFSEQLDSLKEHLSLQESLAAESRKDLDLAKVQLAKALEQVVMDKVEIRARDDRLQQKMQELMEMRELRQAALALVEEKDNKLVLSESIENEFRRQMEKMTANVQGQSKMLDDFECRALGTLKNHKLRLEDARFHLESLVKTAEIVRKKELMYKQRLERRSADLQMAEAEVDLLGDEVDTLLSLLEKIYIALDHYSPILQHYPGIIEILKLVRRELSGESTKSLCSTP